MTNPVWRQLKDKDDEMITWLPGRGNPWSLYYGLLARTFQVSRERERARASRGVKDGTDDGVWDAAVMDDVPAMAWRIRINEVWSILEKDRRMQRLIEWRMDNQRFDDRVLLESVMKEERLKT